MAGELTVNVSVTYMGNTGITSLTKSINGSSGNPRFAASQTEKLIYMVSADVQSALAAIYGDVRNEES